MDRQLLERMIGAGVLIVALVLIVPAILDGQRDDDPAVGSDAESGSGSSTALDEPTRTHTMLLDRQPETPPMAREKTEAPVIDPEQSKSGAEVIVSPPAIPPTQAAKPKPTAQAAKQATTNESTEVTQSAETPKSAAPAVASQPARPSREAVPGSGWAVQLGSFADKQNAERLAAAVSKNGFAAYLMSSEQSGKTLYRVRVGPRDSREQASELAERLAKAGYKGQVTQQRPDS